MLCQNSLQRMATNQSSVGADLLAALSQFFELFPAQRANPLYVTGESYAGKYVPACAYAIHARNAQLPPSRRINLQGISIGDGAFAPEVQLSGGFGDLLYNVGMVSHEERAVFYDYEVREWMGGYIWMDEDEGVARATFSLSLSIHPPLSLYHSPPHASIHLRRGSERRLRPPTRCSPTASSTRCSTATSTPTPLTTPTSPA